MAYRTTIEYSIPNGTKNFISTCYVETLGGNLQFTPSDALTWLNQFTGESGGEANWPALPPGIGPHFVATAFCLSKILALGSEILTFKREMLDATYPDIVLTQESLDISGLLYGTGGSYNIGSKDRAFRISAKTLVTGRNSNIWIQGLGSETSQFAKNQAVSAAVGTFGVHFYAANFILGMNTFGNYPQSKLSADENRPIWQGRTPYPSVVHHTTKRN